MSRLRVAGPNVAFNGASGGFPGPYSRALCLLTRAIAVETSGSLGTRR